MVAAMFSEVKKGKEKPEENQAKRSYKTCNISRPINENGIEISHQKGRIRGEQ